MSVSDSGDNMQNKELLLSAIFKLEPICGAVVDELPKVDRTTALAYIFYEDCLI